MDNQNVKKIKGALYALFAAMIWGFAFVAQSSSADKAIGSFTFNATRSFIGAASIAIIYTIISVAKKKRGENISLPPKQFKKTIFASIVIGTVLCLATNFQQIGIQYTEVGKASFITALYLVLVPIAGLLFGIKPSVNVWVAVGLSAVGLYFLCMTTSGFSIQKGDTFVIICAVCFMLHIITINRLAVGIDGILLSLFQFIVAGTESAVLMFIFESPSLEVISSCAVELLYVGVLSSGVAYTLQILAQQNSDPTVATILFSLESVFGAIGGAIVKHEVMTTRAYIGCGIMLVAVLLAQLPVDKLFKKKAK